LRHVRALTVSDEIGRLAYVVLRTVNRMQAKGSPVRIVAPRDPDVAHELGMDTDEDVILTAVEYLLEQGYVVPAGLDLQGGPTPSRPRGWSGSRRVRRGRHKPLVGRPSSPRRAQSRRRGVSPAGFSES
jgi:hypothetical protein